MINCLYWPPTLIWPHTKTPISLLHLKTLMFFFRALGVFAYRLISKCKTWVVIITSQGKVIFQFLRNMWVLRFYKIFALNWCITLCTLMCFSVFLSSTYSACQLPNTKKLGQYDHIVEQIINYRKTKKNNVLWQFIWFQW